MANNCDNKPSKRIIDWPYKIRHKCVKNIHTLSMRCENKCANFVSPINERLCGLCHKKFDCDCLNGEGRRRMCQGQTKEVEKTTPERISPTDDESSSYTQADVQLLVETTCKKFKELNNIRPKLSTEKLTCLNKLHQTFQMYQINKDCDFVKDMLLDPTKIQYCLNVKIKFLKKIQLKLDCINESKTVSSKAKV